ncbi:gp53-like domain-containing protein [Pseudomonas aeruginosa]|uniref:gp53-like domain-containing protein n=1 Tax=Pseudomonas aeruginosa TaxID=287 RepID=UPI003D9A5ACA
MACQSGSWASLFDSSEIANPGYTRLPSGLIIQYGSFGGYSTGGFSGANPPKVIFRKPFTTACISASGTHMMGYGSATAAAYAAIVSCDKTGIQFDATVPGRHWMAIGY